MSAFRILHLSDLHARAPWQTDQREIVDAMFADAATLARERPFDLAVVSGDVAFSGQPEQYAIAREVLLDPLATRLGLAPDRVILAAGNHDVDRELIDEINEIGLQGFLTDRERANELLDDPEKLAGACARLGGWKGFHDEYYAVHPPRAVEPLAFVWSLQVREMRVGAAALSSAWRCSGDDDRGRLLLGDRQVKRALDAIDDADVRLVVVHHPLEWLASFDADSARGLFEQRMTIVLSGHEHTPDPVGQTGSRGQAVYSRTGCLYEAHGYRNAYHVLDVDPHRGRVEIAVRAWSSRRRAFDADVDVAAGGTLTFALPTDRLLPVARPSFTPVLQGLGELAQEVSVVGDRLGERADATIDQLLVERRFWPLRYSEIAAARELDESEADPVDAVAAVGGAQVVVVCGDAESGVTSALLWLLARRFEHDDERFPAFIRFDRGLSKATRLERAVREAAGRLGLQLERGDDLPPALIAVDDVDVSHAGSLNGFLRYVSENGHQRFLLGCHGRDDTALASALERRGITFERLYLGPLGRGEMRELVDKLTGGGSTELLDKALGLVLSQQLPRTPFVLGALIAILSQETDVTALNVSSLLDAYVKWLLGGQEAADFEGLGLDYRRREHLLGWFASELVRGGTTRVPRAKAERMLLDYYDAKGITSASARVLDSLVARRVLIEDRDGVGFRHPALLDLFAGRAMLDDATFASWVVERPLEYQRAVQHAAGLRRSDSDLLHAVDKALRETLDHHATDVRVDMFDAVRTRPGWSDEDPTFEQLKASLESIDPDDGVEDEQLDMLYDQVEAHPPAAGARSSTPALLQAIASATALAGNVLRSSELVDDVPLKLAVLKRVLHAWSLVCILTAVREDQTAELREALRRLVEDEDPGQPELDRMDRLAELLAVFTMVYLGSGVVGSPHLQRVLERVLDDDEFMSVTAHAVFTTMAYCQLGFRGWPARLAELYDQHGSHPLVAELSRTYALIAYRRRRATGQDDQRLEAFLVDTHSASPSLSGASAVLTRGATRSALVVQLRQSRDGPNRPVQAP